MNFQLFENLGERDEKSLLDKKAGNKLFKSKEICKSYMHSKSVLFQKKWTPTLKSSSLSRYQLLCSGEKVRVTVVNIKKEIQ
jgi:hypothetical protein